MEIKEAVGILKGLQEPEAWEPQITEKTFEALDMAIMALERSDDKSRFFTLEYDFQYSIKVDKDTGVMYAVSNGNNNAGTFTPLINADGKPLIYKPLIYKQIIKESDLVKMGVIEPCEIKAGQVDPIDRQAALDIFDDYNISVENGELEAYSRDRKRLCELPNCSEIPNSSDAINRQDAIDALDKRFDNIPMQLTEEILKLRKDLRELPPIQPEAKEGEWELKDHMWECNKCGCRINMKNPLDCDKWNYYYCPHCGTKMLIAVQRGR